MVMEKFMYSDIVVVHNIMHDHAYTCTQFTYRNDHELNDRHDIDN